MYIHIVLYLINNTNSSRYPDKLHCKKHVYRSRWVEYGSLLFSRKNLVRNGLKKDDVLFSLLFNLELEYVVRQAQEQDIGLEAKGEWEISFSGYADDLNLVGNNKKSIVSTNNKLRRVKKWDLRWMRERQNLWWWEKGFNYRISI